VRLFVAVDVGPDVRREAARVLDELRARVGRLAPRARISWVTPQRMHLTVCFIGEVDSSVCAAVEQALTPPLPVPSFDLTIGTTGTFPPGRPPRVIWAGVTGGQEPLRTIEHQIRARLEAAGLRGERERYRPHLTLARVRHPAGLRAVDLLAGLGAVVYGTVPVQAVTLFESRLTAPPTYVERRQTVLMP